MAITRNAADKTTAVNNKNLDSYTCWCCGHTYNRLNGNFHTTDFPLFKLGYYPICRKCTTEFYEDMLTFYKGNPEKALELMCCMYGVYYNKSLIAPSDKKKRYKDRFTAYKSMININPWQGKTYLDSIAEGETSSETKIDNISPQTKKFFGDGFSDDDYEFLQDEYDDWVCRCEVTTKAMEEIVKRLCFKQLEIYKATLAGLNTKDLDDTFQKLLDSAGLKPKTLDNDKLAQDRTFGQLIRIWEDEKPIPEPAEEFKDVDGIVHYISVYFLGHLAKMVGIKNRYSRMYDEEMKKYTVQKPEYEEDSEALFDTIFGDKSDSEEK